MLASRKIRVMEFCQVAAGPFCGTLPAGLGADVIKVESPEGDGMRRWPPINTDSQVLREIGLSAAAEQK